MISDCQAGLRLVENRTKTVFTKLVFKDTMKRKEKCVFIESNIYYKFIHSWLRKSNVWLAHSTRRWARCACRPGHGLAYFIRLNPQKAINNHCNSFNPSKHLYPGVTTRLLNHACFKCMYVEVYPLDLEMWDRVNIASRKWSTVFNFH